MKSSNLQLSQSVHHTCASTLEQQSRPLTPHNKTQHTTANNAVYVYMYIFIWGREGRREGNIIQWWPKLLEHIFKRFQLFLLNWPLEYPSNELNIYEVINMLYKP